MGAAAGWMGSTECDLEGDRCCESALCGCGFLAEILSLGNNDDSPKLRVITAAPTRNRAVRAGKLFGDLVYSGQLLNDA